MTDNLAVANSSVQLHDRVAHANSGTLLLICAYIDALAAYNVGRDRESVRGHNVSIKADFLRFVNEYMSGLCAASVRRPGRDWERTVMTDRCSPTCIAKQKPREKLSYKAMLYTLYRNGVAHEFLPRGWAAYRRGQGPYLEWDVRRRRLIINIDYLLADFRQALHRYCDDVRRDRTKRTLYRRRLRFLLRH